jgi:flagellar biogenesis protein FliO
MEPTIKNPNALPSALRCGWWVNLWRALPAVRVRRAPRRLRVCESLSLGEKRMVAVIQYEEQKFLVGGGTGSVALLARLDSAPDFAQLLTEWCERQR